MSRIAIVALVATLVAIPGAYARPSATPGVTASTILIGGSGPLSGPEVAYAGTMIGAKAYFDYVNSLGGVNGRKIEYRYLDDGYDPSRTVQNARRLAQQDGVFAMFNIVGTEQNLAVRPFLNALKVPAALRRHRHPRDRPRVQEVQVVDGLPPELLRGRTTLRQAPDATRKNAKVAVLYESSDYGRDCSRA